MVRWGVLLAVLTGTGLVPSGTAAGQAVERHTIRIGVIHASNDPAPALDPAIEPVRRRLESHFHFASYRMILQVALSLAANETGRVLLPNDTRLEIVPTAFDGRAIHMDLKIIRQQGEEQVIEISARSSAESYLIIGGESHKNGILILVVSPGS